MPIDSVRKIQFNESFDVETEYNFEENARNTTLERREVHHKYVIIQFACNVNGRVKFVPLIHRVSTSLAWKNARKAAEFLRLPIEICTRKQEPEKPLEDKEDLFEKNRAEQIKAEEALYRDDPEEYLRPGRDDCWTHREVFDYRDLKRPFDKRIKVETDIIQLSDELDPERVQFSKSRKEIRFKITHAPLVRFKRAAIYAFVPLLLRFRARYEDRLAGNLAL